MKVLIAVDFSPIGREVARSGYEMAQSGGMDAVFFHCAPQASRFLEGYDIKAFISPLSKNDQQQIMEFGKHNHTNVEEHLTQGDASEEILKYAKNNSVNLIYLGYKSYSAIAELLIGSTAAKIVRYAPCSVLIYRPEK